jgi:hypothetical protein
MEDAMAKGAATTAMVVIESVFCVVCNGRMTVTGGPVGADGGIRMIQGFQLAHAVCAAGRFHQLTLFDKPPAGPQPAEASPRPAPEASTAERSPAVPTTEPAAPEASTVAPAEPVAKWPGTQYPTPEPSVPASPAAPPSAELPAVPAEPAPTRAVDAAPSTPPAAEYRPAVCFSIATADYDAHEDVLTWEGHDEIAFSWEPDDTGARHLSEPIEVPTRAEVLRKQLAAAGVTAEEFSLPAPRPSATHVVFFASCDAWHALEREAQDKLRNPIKKGRRKASDIDQARWAVSCWPNDVHDEGGESLIASVPIELGPIADAVRATAAGLGLPLREQPAPVWTCRRCNAEVLATYDPMTYGRLCAGGVCDDCTTKAVRAYRERDRATRAVDAEKRKPGRKSKAKAPPPAEQPTVPVPTAAAPEPAAEPVTICMALADWERITDDNATAGALTCSTEQTEIEWHIDGTTDGKDTVSDPLSGEDLEQVRRVLGAAGVGWIEKGPTTFRTVPPRDPKPSKKSRATPAAPPFAEVLKHDDPLEVARTSKNAHVLVVKEPGEKWLRVLSGTSKPGMRTAFEERAGIVTNGEHAGTELRWYHREQLVDRTIGTSTPGAEGTDATTAAEPAEAVS